MTKSKTTGIEVLTAKDRRNSDLIFNRMIVVLVAAAAALCGLFIIKRDAMSGISKTEVLFVVNVLPILTIVCGVLFAAALIYFILKRVKGISEADKLITSYSLLGMASVLFFVTLFYKSLTGIYAIAVVIAAALLYFVYCLYERDFFWCSLTAAFGSFLLLAGRSVSPLISFGALALAIVLSIAVILLFLMMKKNGGKLTVGGKKRSIMKPGYQYTPILVLAAVVLAFAALTLITTTFVLYCILALLAVYLLIGIIYTVKMI
ncbi:MAG: hypothetical protein IJA85_12160 [Clostridia bacterium]|nr:hypothetical protein [Clostridia bacterium]MBQ4575927.1 hypothetical protein [Clostridia bacterium]